MLDKVIVIAEIGVNHNGSIDEAFALVRAARNAGADYVKFQTFKASSIATPSAALADYQRQNIELSDQSNQREMLHRLELSFSEFRAIQTLCLEMNIGFISTAFDAVSLKFIKSLGVDFLKIPSGEITNFPFLVTVAKSDIPILMSTGMSTMTEVAEALEVLRKFSSENLLIIPMQCTSSYPAPVEDLNLGVIQHFRDRFKLPVGFSDHSAGIEAALAAVAMGAVIIEKHFTLDRNALGPDHSASLEPTSFRRMVDGIRNVEKALGSRDKFVTPSEEQNRKIARRSIVSAREIKKGEIFTEENITSKRPANGLSPMCWNQLIGRQAERDYQSEELIDL